VTPRLQFAAEQTHQAGLLGGEVRHLVAIQPLFQAQTIGDGGVNEAGDFFTHVKLSSRIFRLDQLSRLLFLNA